MRLELRVFLWLENHRVSDEDVERWDEYAAEAFWELRPLWGPIYHSLRRILSIVGDLRPVDNDTLIF